MQNGFFYWYGPDVSMSDDVITQQQYDDYIATGIYKEADCYDGV